MAAMSGSCLMIIRIRTASDADTIVEQVCRDHLTTDTTFPRLPFLLGCHLNEDFLGREDIPACPEYLIHQGQCFYSRIERRIVREPGIDEWVRLQFSRIDEYPDPLREGLC